MASDEQLSEAGDAASEAAASAGTTETGEGAAEEVAAPDETSSDHDGRSAKGATEAETSDTGSTAAEASDTGSTAAEASDKASTEAEASDKASTEAEASGTGSTEAEPESPAAAEAAPESPAIPPPSVSGKAQAQRGAPRSSGGLSLGAAVAMAVFVIIGGVLVFGFAQALVPAAQSHRGAACRPMTPTPLEGAAPQLELEDLAGNPVSLADYRGKFLIVNFWATWCEPCTREWPDLSALAERVAERDDIVLVAIAIDEEKAELAPYLQRMGLTNSPVEVLWAKDSEAHISFGSEKIPDTYFVNREGELEAVFVNIREWSSAQALRCVEAAAEG